jgi:hypothetical protein
MVSNSGGGKLRSSIAIILSLVCLLSPLLFSSVSEDAVRASPATVVKVDPQTSHTQTGQNFSVSIKIDDVQDLYGVEIVLSWNSTILQAVDAVSSLGVEDYPGGVLHKPIIPIEDRFNNSVEAGLGKYIVVCASMFPAGSFNGSGTVALVTFNVLKDESCNLTLGATLASNIMGDGTVLPIDHTTEDGFFNKMPPSPPGGQAGFDWGVLVMPMTAVIVVAIVLVTAIWFLGREKRRRTSCKEREKRRAKKPKTIRGPS